MGLLWKTPSPGVDLKSKPPSPTRLDRALHSYLPRERLPRELAREAAQSQAEGEVALGKTWMAGTSPAMT